MVDYPTSSFVYNTHIFNIFRFVSHCHILHELAIFYRQEGPERARVIHRLKEKMRKIVYCSTSHIQCMSYPRHTQTQTIILKSNLITFQHSNVIHTQRCTYPRPVFMILLCNGGKNIKFCGVDTNTTRAQNFLFCFFLVIVNIIILIYFLYFVYMCYKYCVYGVVTVL